MRPDESFVGQPIRSLQTMLRILSEDDPNYLVIVPDGIYGQETMAAVSRFQQLHGLPVTGVTDLVTWEAIVLHQRDARIRRERAWPLEILLEPGEVLRSGSRHPHIPLLQAMLTVLARAWPGIPAPELTGILDAATADSLMIFQSLSGLAATGELDKVTWKHLALHYPQAANLSKENYGKGKALKP